MNNLPHTTVRKWQNLSQAVWSQFYNIDDRKTSNIIVSYNENNIYEKLWEKLSKPLKFFVKKTGIKLQSKILNGLNK